MPGVDDVAWAGETGFLIWVSAIAWTLMSAATSGGTPPPEIALVVAVGAAFVVGTVSARAARWLAPTVVLGLALLLVITSPGDVFGNGAIQGPFGYANAKGSFFAVAALAALMVATAVPTRVGKLGAMGAAVLCAAVPFAIGSLAAGVLAALLGPAALAMAAVDRTRVFAIGVGVLAAGAVAATVVLGALFEPVGEHGSVERASAAVLSERRPALWHDALGLMADHPVFGVGPGRFQVTSRVALSDPDARWAHNEFVQQGAEQGVPGLILLAAGFAWGFGRLAARPGRLAALGAASLGTLAVQGSIDYVMHFPAIPIAVALLVGAATAPRARARSTGPPIREQESRHATNVGRP
jgi:O-antigen ligase